MRLATHCRDSWVRPLRAPARMRPQLGDRFLMDYFPRPLEGGGRRFSCMPGGPCAHRAEASRSRPRSAAAHQGRAAARGARSAWSMGRRPAPGAGAWAGASAAAAGRATKATPAPRRATAAPGPSPALRRGARYSSPKPGARGRPRCPPGWGGHAQPPRPSRAKTLRRPADVQPCPGSWALAPPPPCGPATPGPRNARRPRNAKRLTGLTGPTGGARLVGWLVAAAMSRR